MSLYDVLKMNRYRGFWVQESQNLLNMKILFDFGRLLALAIDVSLSGGMKPTRAKD